VLLYSHAHRSPEHNYFFYLYITYVGCQLVLTAVALLWHPADEDLLLVVEDGYMVSQYAATDTSHPLLCTVVTNNVGLNFA
jgi:hypothetical protein